MAGFSYRKNLDGSAYVPSLLTVGVKASTTYSVGDMIRINTSGTASLAAATTAVAGVLATVTDANGLAVTPDSGTTDTWTIAASGATTNYKVKFIPALPNYLFYANGDADTAVGDLFAYTDLTDENSPANSFGDTAATLKLIERNPDHDADDSKGLYQVVESQFGQTDSVPAA